MSDVWESTAAFDWDMKGADHHSFGENSVTAPGDFDIFTDDPVDTVRGTPTFNNDSGNDSKFTTKGCFNCGEEGHLKADCTAPRVERAFDGICNECGESGHKALDCKGKRHLKFENIATMDADEAWKGMAKAAAEQDGIQLREFFFAYLKAVTQMQNGKAVDLVDMEKGFRESGSPAHLVALIPEVVPKDKVIVDFEGNTGKPYLLDIVLMKKAPKRKIFARIAATDDEENLLRLANCGVMQSCGAPLCSRCDELGHISKHCPQEKSAAEVRGCANCGDPDHRVRACPAERKTERSSRACFKCGSEEHMASDCQQEGGNNDVECRRCHEVGHFAKDCPNAGGSRACHNCGEDGHIARDCEKPREAATVTCRNCNQAGHMAKECPEPRNMANVTCNNCDAQGHMSRECPKPRDYSRVTCRQCGEKGHTIVRCKAGELGNGEFNNTLTHSNDTADPFGPSASDSNIETSLPTWKVQAREPVPQVELSKSDWDVIPNASNEGW